LHHRTGVILRKLRGQYITGARHTFDFLLLHGIQAEEMQRRFDVRIGPAAWSEEVDEEGDEEDKEDEDGGGTRGSSFGRMGRTMLLADFLGVECCDGFLGCEEMRPRKLMKGKVHVFSLLEGVLRGGLGWWEEFIVTGRVSDEERLRGRVKAQPVFTGCLEVEQISRA
jgi:hypothetical protein